MKFQFRGLAGFLVQVMLCQSDLIYIGLTLRKVFYKRNESSYRGGAHSVPTSSSNRKLRFPQRNPMAGMSSSEQCTIRAAKRTVGDNDNT